MKKDITTREDIDQLMNVFYEKLLKDDTINYIFTDVMKINIKTHIPVIADFLGKHFIQQKYVSQ